MQVCTSLQADNDASIPPLRKTYKYNKNLFKSKKTTYNKRLATKTVADWELQVVVSRAEPVRIAFDWRE